MTNQDVLVLAKQYVAEVKKSGIPVKTAYLFGSYSNGTAHKDSDIDICIVSPLFSTDRQTERVKLMGITHLLSEDIEPHPISLQEYNSRFNPFIKEVKKGIKLV